MFSVLDGVALSLKKQVCHLGVLLDPGLVLDEQVATVVRSAFYQFCLLSQLMPFLGRKERPIAVCALVTSSLNYCDILPKKSLQKLMEQRSEKKSTNNGNQFGSLLMTFHISMQ